MHPERDHETPATITVGTRDLVRLEADLGAWLVTTLGDGADAAVSGLHVPAANGMSSETVLFDAEWSERGIRTKHELVARVAPDPANKPVFREYDMDKQFRTIALVEELGAVPVPHPYWSEPDPAPIGSPFFVMQRISGKVPPDNLPYNFGSWVTEATPEQRSRLQESSVRTLAAVHGLDRAHERFTFLEYDAPGGSPLRRHVNAQRNYYQWVAGETPSPLLEACFTWLEEHWPEHEGETVLSWGDARIGNTMYRDFEPVAVFDWEMAGLGPREIDLAWFIFLHRFFEDITTTYGMPGLPDFLRRPDVEASYERYSGHTPQDMDFYFMYAALRHGVVMSQTQRRAIHFGEAEMPDDIDDLIMHRTTLEKMLDGTYWPAVLS